MSVPDDAPRSDDGLYWWDGSEWRSVEQADGGGQSGGGVIVPPELVEALQVHNYPELVKIADYGDYPVQYMLEVVGIDPQDVPSENDDPNVA